MISVARLRSKRPAWWEEAGKIAAFFRRDLVQAWSYRLAFFTNWASLLYQVLIFYFIGKLIDPGAVPVFGEARPSYLQFVLVGIAVASFMQIGLGRVVAAIRQEQLMGTLESLLLTPTTTPTLLLGFVSYELVYVPVRVVFFLAAASLLFDASFSWAGMAPSIAILVSFLPFVWGIGIISAAAELTFRRSSAFVGSAATVLITLSGAYFPLTVFPSWIQAIARNNPIAVGLDGVRSALLGGAGWSDSVGPILTLLPYSAVALVASAYAFRLALRRERRLGTLGQY